MIKKHFFFLLIIYSTYLQSQTYVKVNGLTTLLTIPNVGLETSIGGKSTFQFDITASFWKSIRGERSQFYLFIPEYRYHFNEKYKGFYIGSHIGFTLFNVHKLNYLNTNLYQKGFGYLMGVTIGYQIKVNDRFLLDCFIGGGNSQGFYKGYNTVTNVRYENADNYNKSGEWLPYRGGFMVSYRIK